MHIHLLPGLLGRVELLSYRRQLAFTALCVKALEAILECLLLGGHGLRQLNELRHERRLPFLGHPRDHMGGCCLLPRAFPSALAGRVVTAINLLVFVGAFAFQWGIGEVIDLWPPTEGGYAPEAYRVAFGILLALELLSLGWFFVARRWSPVTR